MRSRPTVVKIHMRDNNHIAAGNKINGMYPSNKYHIERLRSENGGKTFVYAVYPRGEENTKSRHSRGLGYNEI